MEEHADVESGNDDDEGEDGEEDIAKDALWKGEGR